MEQLRVNTGFAGIYKEATFGSEMVSQVLLWEKLIVLARKKEFFFVRAEDGYQGWVNAQQVIYLDDEPDFDWKTIFTLRGSILEKPEENSLAIRDFSIGSRIPVVNVDGSWSEVLLPDGQRGWIKSIHLDNYPREKRVDFINIANRFLGIPYLWGGKSGSGLDCSGFTQLVHKLFGIHIRRDAWMQFEDACPASDNVDDAYSGDLYFFSEKGEKISHVGIALGHGMMLHTRGYVRLNSLLPEQELYDGQLRKQFVSVKTFFTDELAPVIGGEYAG